MIIFNYKEQKYKLILFNLKGSRFYNTHFEKGEHPFDPEYESDYDYTGVYIPFNDDILGLNSDFILSEINPNTEKDANDRMHLIKQINESLNMNIPLDNDISLYSVKKFLKMASENNPNIMDTLYIDEDSTYYKDELWDIILSKRDMFLSKVAFKTFSEYAKGQFYKMKQHHKMIVKYPKVNIIANLVKDAYLADDINYQWINDNFSGDLAQLATGLTQQDANKIKISKHPLSFAEFAEKYVPSDININLYRRPLLIDFIHIKDDYAKKYNVNSNLGEIKGLSKHTWKDKTISEVLFELASFRTLGQGVYNIFEKPESKYNGGIFGKDGNIRSNDPKEVGENKLFSILVQKNEYKTAGDEIQKLWYWKKNRNPKRSILEEKFGYDTKNALHLVRLLIGAKNILKDHDYKPRLSGSQLEEVKSVLVGKFSYDEIVEFSNKHNDELTKSAHTSTLKDSVDLTEVNKVLLEIIHKNA